MPAGRSSPFSAFRAEAAFSSAPTPIEEPAPIHRTAFLANSFLFPTPRGACIPTPPGALRSSARSLESQGVGPPLFGPPGVIPSARVDAVFEVRVGHGAGIKCQMVVGGGPVEGRWGGGGRGASQPTQRQCGQVGAPRSSQDAARRKAGARVRGPGVGAAGRLVNGVSKLGEGPLVREGIGVGAAPSPPSLAPPRPPAPGRDAAT